MNDEINNNNNSGQFQNNINDNNNNNNNNINNDNLNNANDNNNRNNENQNNINYIKKYTKITISFVIIFIINLTLEIYSYFNKINARKYVFQFSPIYEKNQYYRFISNYFIHFGFGHKIIELYFTYKICNLLENIIGTIITISLIMISMIMNSVVQFLLIKSMIYILNLMHCNIDLNYDYQGGLTSVLFTMLTIYFSFKINSRKQITILSILIFPARYLSFAIFILLICLTPNKSFFSNFSGILIGYIIKILPSIFLPRINWVRDFEMKFMCKCEKLKFFYRSINTKNMKMVNVLNELQNNSMNDNYNYENDFNDVVPRMNETSNNINNNGNDEQ